jgi:hypothetical protein
VASASSTEKALKATFSGKVRGGNLAGAEALGQVIAGRLKEKGISRVVFDRGGNLYHGRIRAVADAARKAGWSSDMMQHREKIDPSDLELKDTVVSISRVTKVVKGGKNLSFSALVVVGDGHGVVGFGIGKAKEVPSAIKKRSSRRRRRSSGRRWPGRRFRIRCSDASAPVPCCSSPRRMARASLRVARCAPSSNRRASTTS